jgi:hypothetical protein
MEKTWKRESLDLDSETSGDNVMKLFMAVIYRKIVISWSFFPRKSFRPSILLSVRPGTYPRVEHLKGA